MFAFQLYSFSLLLSLPSSSHPKYYQQVKRCISETIENLGMCNPWKRELYSEVLQRDTLLSRHVSFFSIIHLPCHILGLFDKVAWLICSRLVSHTKVGRQSSVANFLPCLTCGVIIFSSR